MAKHFDQFIKHDKRAVIVTDLSGFIHHHNAAAVATFGDPVMGSLEQVVAKVISDAAAVIFRLQVKADKQGAASETLDHAGRTGEITVHHLSDDRLLWAFGLQAGGGQTAPENAPLHLPMLVASRNGTIISMSHTLRDLVGNRAKSLGAIFDVMPKASGDQVKLLSGDGMIDKTVTMVPAGADCVEYYLTPPRVSDKDGGTLDVLDHFPVPLLKMSVDGAIQDANDLAKDLLCRADLSSTTIMDVLEGLGRPMPDWLLEASQGRAVDKPEVLKVKAGDQETYVQITLGQMTRDGAPAVLAMLNDATELKTLEAQFVQSQKMQAIGQLAGGVAHDFNNLLTAISGHCDLLMLRHDAGDPEYGDLEQINQNANRAASLVGQLLAFSRKQNLQPEVLDMRDTLSDLTHLLNRLVGAQISLTLTHDTNLSPVRSDRRQLEQVIMNLVVNSRDAIDGNGEISIRTRNAQLDKDMHRDRAVVPKGDYVVVEVADNGCGIASDKVNKIFEPFFTTKRTGEGTGLGLSTAYGIIKQSGGFIFVDSTLGEGTTFTILFPSTQAAQPSADDNVAPLEKVDLTPVEGVVLLVEDEAPVRAFASRALRLRGFEVVEAECAEDAMELLLNEGLQVDVVVSDVVMPGLDGPTWVKKVRETQPDLRVIFVSGYAEDSFGDGQTAMDNTVFLPKPFSLNELTNLVQCEIARVG